MTYKDAGVDIKAGDNLVERIKILTKNLPKKAMLGGIGSFGGAYSLANYKNPVLISGTDGVGTKLKLAFILDKHDTVGIDLVAMCINDIITSGAAPLFFLDYFATGHLSIEKAEQVIKGIIEGCRQAECVLLGGETAEMPSFYGDEEYDLAGFAVGAVEKEDMIDGKNIELGYVVIGIPSSGVHSNGFSLIRKVFDENGLKKYADKLITPTRIYWKDVKNLFEKKIIKGMAHITGGGLSGNANRIFAKDAKIDIKIDTKSIELPEIFKIIKKTGNVDIDEMYKVFNMGIGMVLIVNSKDVETVLKNIKDAKVIGNIIEGNGKVILI
ncbi:MAG: phosphoribosylformylglycinamidine cyclo-ligase [Elusimicrobiota bacterium]|nr:phosphoribosylformylglycinamidine cyclo-ligase [Elusimicrobiota bacterium]